MTILDEMLERARAVPIETIARSIPGLKRNGRRMAGPCPTCNGNDRFWVDLIKGNWGCRHCKEGGDVIDLTKFIHGVEFGEAIRMLANEPAPGKMNGASAKAEDLKKFVVERYSYTDERGGLLFEVERVQYKKTDGTFALKDGKPKKTFRQRRPDPGNPGQWIYNIDGVRRVPYKLPKLTSALSLCEEIFIVEGERKVDVLLSWGIPATCNAMGAENWNRDHAEYLRGVDAVILSDNDEAGRTFRHKVGASLVGVAMAVRVLDLPDLPQKGDIVDWAKAGGNKDKLLELVGTKAEPWAPDPSIKEDPSPGFSDDYLALAFTERHASDLRYISPWSQWMCFDGKSWREDETLSTFDKARKVCRELSPKAGKKAKEVASAKTISAIERLAKSDRRIAATIDQWDADPWLLNTPDGVIDLRTGELRAHLPDDYMTRITAVAPGGYCPLWIKFIDRVTDHDQELAAFLQRMLGYALTGSTKEHGMFFLYGTGGNGKGVLLNTIASIIADYHTTAPIETFTAAQIERHPTELAALRGARIVTAVETKEGRGWDETKIKALTGGDKISARFMRQDFFEYIPQFKLIIAGNHKRSLRTVDEAIRRRFHLVPFTVTIPREERDPGLPEKLKAELPGILRWLIEGCLSWQRDGLDPPKAVREATDAYLEAEDIISAWLSERYDRDPDGWVTSAALFSNWQSYANQSGETVGTQHQLAKRIEGHGLVGPTKFRGERGYWGVKLKM
jgi:putative DNA primase/helicase